MAEDVDNNGHPGFHKVLEFLPIVDALRSASVCCTWKRLSTHEALRRCGEKGCPTIVPGDFCLNGIPCQHTVAVYYGEEEVDLGGSNAIKIVQLARSLKTDIPSWGGDSNHFTWYQCFPSENFDVGRNIQADPFFVFGFQWMAMEESRKAMRMTFFELHKAPKAGLRGWLMLPVLYRRAWKSLRSLRVIEQNMPAGSPWHPETQMASNEGDENTGYTLRPMVTPPIPDYLSRNLAATALWFAIGERYGNLGCSKIVCGYCCVVLCYIDKCLHIFVGYLQHISIAIIAYIVISNHSWCVRLLLLLFALMLFSSQPIIDDVNSEMRKFVFHDYTAVQDEQATRDEDMADMQADYDWADHVEQRIQAAGVFQQNDEHRGQRESEIASQHQDSLEVLPDQASSHNGSNELSAQQENETSRPEKVHLLRFSKGDTDRFRDALLRGPELKACRDALSDHGHPCVLPSGSFIFVKPEQFQAAKKALCGTELHPFHVIIAERFEYLLDEMLEKFAYKKRPREKRQCRQQLECNPECTEGAASSNEEAEQTGDCGDLVHSRTFLCAVPVLRSAQSVVQSTTEVFDATSPTHYSAHRGKNPRRISRTLMGDLRAWARMLSFQRAMKHCKVD